MSEVEIFPNPEAGNIWIGWILAQSYSKWPSKIEISPSDVLQGTNVGASEGLTVHVIYDLILWMREENYIRFQTYTDSDFFDITLTEKSLVVLNSRPEKLNSTFGKKLTETANEIGKEGGKTALGELIGQIITVIYKGFTT